MQRNRVIRYGLQFNNPAYRSDLLLRLVPPPPWGRRRRSHRLRVADDVDLLLRRLVSRIDLERARELHQSCSGIATLQVDTAPVNVGRTRFEAHVLVARLVANILGGLWCTPSCSPRRQRRSPVAPLPPGRACSSPPPTVRAQCDQRVQRRAPSIPRSTKVPEDHPGQRGDASKDVC